jgi:tetratricopeptide (TPR) repeat protein
MTGQGLVRLAVIVAAVAGGVAWYLANRTDPSVLVAKAEAELQERHWEAARSQVRRLEGIRRPTPKDRSLRARIEIGAGDDARALEELRQIVDDPELAPQALYMTGLIERHRQRLRYAEAAYRKAIRLEPGLIPARKELIYILGMQSRRRELDAEFKDLARFAPLTHYDLYIWCLTHFVNWGPDSAEDLQPFLSADPEDRRTRVAIATLLLGQPGQEGRVEEVLEPLPPDDPDVLALRIEKELNRGRIDEATRMIAGTQADDPRLARLRARIALRRGERAAAVGYFRQALSDEPYDRVSNSELGKALLLQGSPAEAESYLDRARHLDEVYNLVTRIAKPQKDPQPPDLIRLARACESAGLIDEARGWYQLAIGQNPLDPEAQQGLRRLRPTPDVISTRRGDQ